MNTSPADENQSIIDNVSPAEAGNSESVESSQSSLASPLSIRERLDLARWHIDRYDRLRTSTSSRAAVILSGDAVLSAGNAVILAQVFEHRDNLPLWLVITCTVGLACSASLIILSLMRATGALFVLRSSRESFPDADLPSNLVFNAYDTVLHSRNYLQFESVVSKQTDWEVLQAAHGELWVDIRNYRHRYSKLQRSVLALRNGAVVFLVVSIVLLVANLLTDTA